MAEVRGAEKERRKQFDAEVKILLDKGYANHEIAALLGVHTNRVSASVGRLTGFDKRRTPRYDAEKEAEMMIAVKMAPVKKPRARLVNVDGWENGRYIHKKMWDVSDYWGLS